MATKKTYRQYARVIVSAGVNLKKGEILVINAPISAKELVLEVTKAAYKKGADRVYVDWRDDDVGKLSLTMGGGRRQLEPAKWEIDYKQYMVDNGVCYLNMLSGDPELYADVDKELLVKVARARHMNFAFFSDAVTENLIKWCIVGVPDLAWAKKVFPDLTPKAALNKLWEYVAHIMRLDTANPLAAWKEHNENLKRRSKILNEMGLKRLHYTNALGTDLWLGLPDGYVFEGGSEKHRKGSTFNPNMPTEEIFSAPYKYGVDGKVVASMPLYHNGAKVSGFGFVFEKGKIVDYWAEEGKDILEGILGTDEGSRYLGEVALVPYDSPISNLQTLFLETLFDENASCHLAIGTAYPSCVKGGLEMDEEELEKAGINVSHEHVDFMIGTSDLRIDGETADGAVVEIFVNGNFAF
ncbi:MAG: aminopeptidase [Clostridia bacterium]|nr:aminopeptidase [Clostridia bacterium]